MDLLLLGPALYKIALGLVAHDAGPEAALEQQGQDLADPQQVDRSDIADHGGGAPGGDGTDMLALGS